MAVQGLWSPAGLPFMQLNNTALVFIKVRRVVPQHFLSQLTDPAPHAALRRARSGHMYHVAPVL